MEFNSDTAVSLGLSSSLSCLSLPSPPHTHPLSHTYPLLSIPSDVGQMAIDWLTGNFYFEDNMDDRIFVCNADGQTCVTLLDQELYNPKGIALDPLMG